MTDLLRASRAARLLALGASLTLVTGVAGAQRQSPPRNVVRSEDPATPDYTISRKKGFKLFANGDLAATGMKGSGQFGWILSNLGPCADGFLLGECGDVDIGGGNYQFNIFEILWTAGVPAHEFRKIRKIYPEIGASVKGGLQFSHIHNFALFAGRSEFGPKDGTLGTQFSGAAATSDQSCRDNTSPLNGYMTTGASLLAGSTCSETWGSEGFRGPRPIPDSAFIRAFNADPANFRFDWFKIPDSEKDQTQSLGDFSTYGETNDFYSEILASYGSVTKIGPRTPPTIGGFPLGLDIRFEAFTFGLPTIANVVFYQATVVNKTATVYGAPGVDYDSLYMGLSPGWGRQQASSVYYVPGQSALKSTEIGASGTTNCNGATAPAGVSGCALVGFANAAAGIVGLKSPIGDLRNKLLTKPGTFFNPTSKYADDTITFNHGHMCGFGSCWDATINVNDRRGFGMVSSTEDNVLDGRTVGSLSTTQYWRTFRSAAYPTRDGKFNKYTPGNWDYNNDGVQDTLHFDSCHTNGCVRTWADTMPGKQVNRNSNVGGMMTAGPFALKAGDTTSFIYAFVGGPDSASFEAAIASAIDAYMGFYLTPKPPTPPTITSVEVQATEVGDPYVTLYYSNAPEKYQDAFLLKFGNELAAATSGSLLKLRTENPNLASEILARAVNNFSELYIFKSCDGGNTFTGDADCDGDPAVGPTGKLIGAGWQPYAIIAADTTAGGAIPNSFKDNNVIGGRTYLYSLVTRSRGFRTIIYDSDAPNGVREFALTDTINSSLQRSGPSTRRVYVPISLAAGASPARISNVSMISGPSNVPVDVRFGNIVVGGTYTGTFANRFTVKHYRNTSTGATVDSVFAYDVLFNVDRGGTALAEFVTRTEIFVSAAAVQTKGTVTSAGTRTGVGFTMDSTVLNGLGFVLTDAANRPLFVSTDLDGLTTPDDFSNRADFPGFTVTVDQRTALDADPDFERVLLPNKDTLNVNIMANAVQYQQAVSTRRNNTTGTFIFNFQSDAFGPQSPFTFDAADINNTRAVVQASLAARPDATFGDISLAAKRAYLKQFPADVSLLTVANDTSTLPLRAVSFPFTVTDSTNGRTTTLAMVSRAAKGRPSSIKLGAGVDTLRVNIDSLEWVPGDEFFVLQTYVQDSTLASGAIVVDPTTNRPFQVSRTVVAIGPVVLGCNVPQTSCNPIRFGTRGFSGYYNYQPNTKLIVDYRTPFSLNSKASFTVTPTASTRPVLTSHDKKRIRVVPNPYVFLSAFDEILAGRQGVGRILFTNVPSSGSLRVYSVSGQFLQQLSWTAADLNGTGDLPYNLRSREGTDLTSGLYIYVISTTSASGKAQLIRGKFVVIR